MVPRSGIEVCNYFRLEHTTPPVLVVEQSPTPLLLYSSKLGHSSRYCREYQYCDHSSKLSGIDMTLRCWYVSRKSSGVL